MMKAKQAIKIAARTSSVTNSFVQSILPDTKLTVEEEKMIRVQLGQIGLNAWFCVYCGASATEWDHLFPLVKDRRPSGNLNVFGNLVPACGPCNHSKSAQDWQHWMRGNARNSPTSRKIVDVETRIERLASYAEGYSRIASLEDLYDRVEYESYWKRLDQITALMYEAQRVADQLRAKAKQNYDKLLHASI